MAKELRKRAEFPAADGWVIFENSKRQTIDVLLEPWGVGGEILPGECAHVLIKPDENSPATIIIHGDCIQIYCAQAMYQRDIEVLDMTD